MIHDVAALRHPEAYSRLTSNTSGGCCPRWRETRAPLITVSEFSRGELIDALGAAPERVTVVPEGVDERFFADPDPPAGGRARYGLAGPYALAVGTLSARKNLAALEHAARSLRERGVEFVLAGSDRGYLRGSQAGLVVWATSTTSCCRGCMRAPWRSRCPRATRASGSRASRRWPRDARWSPPPPGALPETCGDAALLVEPTDTAGFAEALIAAACGDQDRTRLIEAGRRRAAEFSWTRTAKLTDALIGNVIGEG